MAESVYRYELRRFNPRRAARGAPAAEVAVYENGELFTVLWMDRADITLNLGQCTDADNTQGLLDAQRAYSGRNEVRCG